MLDNGKEAGISLPTVLSYGDKRISFELRDGSVMINATEMGKAFGKRPKDWLKNQQTKEFLSAVEKYRGENSPNGSDDLIVIEQGGKRQGTWMHEIVALEYARWLNPDFAIWTNIHIKELMRTGSTRTGTAIAEEATMNEGQLYNFAFGREMLRVAHADGRTWIGLYGIGRALGLSRSLRTYQVKHWFAEKNHRTMRLNAMQISMIDAEGFGIILARIRKPVDERIVEAIYKQVYKVVPQNTALRLEFPDAGAEYQFSAAEMNEIFTAVGVPPFNRGQVMKLLSNGKS